MNDEQWARKGGWTSSYGRGVIPRTLYWEHEGNRAIRDGDWKPLGLRNEPWELYRIADDRTELNNLIEQHSEKAEELKSKWDAWAEKVGVLPPAEFDRARIEFRSRQEQQRC